jgi:hypothetical protein
MLICEVLPIVRYFTSLTVLGRDIAHHHRQRDRPTGLASGHFQGHIQVGRDTRRDDSGPGSIEHPRDPVGSLPTVQPSPEVALSHLSFRPFSLARLIRFSGRCHRCGSRTGLSLTASHYVRAEHKVARGFEESLYHHCLSFFELQFTHISSGGQQARARYRGNKRRRCPTRAKTFSLERVSFGTLLNRDNNTLRCELRASSTSMWARSIASRTFSSWIIRSSVYEKGYMVLSSSLYI